jgi:hypothetical protein
VDRLADSLWRAGAAPFDGLTLVTPTLATEQLHAAASRLVGQLEDAFPQVQLHTAEDWLEHDGWVSEPEPAGWANLRSAVETVDAFVTASPEDTYVRCAWLGEGAFYLRWHCSDEGDPPAGGDIDLTADAEVVRAAARELDIRAEIEPAADFFERRWNG